jgi:hypothetical protein
MPAPISQQIADAILAALREISTAAGDTATPDVEEATSIGNIPTDQKFVLVEVDAEDTGAAPEQAIEYLTSYVLFVFVHEPPDSGYSPRTRARYLRSDVIKKLMADYQWGGLAVDTKVTGWEWLDNSADFGANDGLMLRFTVQHRENLYDPYQPR